ncbi:hypothetical protein CU097_012808 [Rhizopus azygosporus]|uniref:Methyltransferase domain-containing protein n=1 Tax=Rhizopus azygosporus TaxID=86630 RepID=A0A367JRW7_RHIAZ|nr:hypothetical protein CU097_012808 [Rhizopus azygosporus]
MSPPSSTPAIGSTTTASNTQIADHLAQSTIMANREFHQVDSSYWLPMDENERQRLTGQHVAIKELYEGNVLSSVKSNLDLQGGISILDVGCGPGVWSMDMSLDYPNCTYHACDIVDITNKRLRMKNFTFKKGDVLKGLPYEDNTFDFVHMRLLTGSLCVDQWPIAIKELIRVTRPGGIIQLTEIDNKLPDPKNEAYYKLISAIHNACKLRNQNPRIALELERLLKESGQCKIVQAEYRSCRMSDNNSMAKKFVWDCVEVTRSMIHAIGPYMGLNDEEDCRQYIRELKQCLTTSDCYMYYNAVAAQKL